MFQLLHCSFLRAQDFPPHPLRGAQHLLSLRASVHVGSLCWRTNSLPPVASGRKPHCGLLPLRGTFLTPTRGEGLWLRLLKPPLGRKGRCRQRRRRGCVKSSENDYPLTASRSSPLQPHRQQSWPSSPYTGEACRGRLLGRVPNSGLRTQNWTCHLIRLAFGKPPSPMNGEGFWTPDSELKTSNSSFFILHYSLPFPARRRQFFILHSSFFIT